MQKVNNWLLFIILFFCNAAYPQSNGNTTLNQAIEAARVRKMLELNLSASAMGTLPTAPHPVTQTAAETKTKTKTRVKTLPQLWSIQGLSNALRAEVVYEGRIYEVSFINDELRIGDWILVGLNEQEAEMAYLESDGNTTYAKADVVRLRLPKNALAASEMFAKAVSLNESATGAPLPTGIAPPDVIPNTKNISKLPSPLNLLKP